MGSKFVRHCACDKCGSSDAGAIYEREDGSSYIKCFSCYAFLPLGNTQTHNEIEMSNDFGFDKTGNAFVIRSITERDLSREVCAFYGVGVDDEGSIRFPYGSGHKYRTKDKKFSTSPVFKEAGLFGQDKFPSGGKYVTITEGEFDAMSGYQMFGNKYPFVSVKNGAKGAKKNCQDQFEWLDSFENIIVCFDADEPGQEAAQEVAELFGAKVKVVKHKPGFKDANDYLMAGKQADFVSSWWSAEEYRPSGIVNGKELWEEIVKPVPPPIAKYPYKCMNDALGGIFEASIIVVTAGSGVGKSQLFREISYGVLTQTDSNMAMMFLEDYQPKKTALKLMSLHANKRLDLHETNPTMEELQESYNATLGSGRIEFYHASSDLSADTIISRMRYLIKGKGCRFVFLDHLSLIVSADKSDNERKFIDELMTQLAVLISDTKATLFVISHLTRTTGDKGHENGAEVTLKQLRGSGAIAQLADVVIACERNQQANSEEERNTMRLRVLKNRLVGETGPVGLLSFSKFTGRLSETAEMEEEAL